MAIPPNNLILDPRAMTAPVGQLPGTVSQTDTMIIPNLKPIAHILPTREQLSIAPAVITSATISAKKPSKASRLRINRVVDGVDNAKTTTTTLGVLDEAETEVLTLDREKIINSTGTYSKGKNVYKTSELKALIASIHRFDPNYNITTQGKKDELIARLVKWIDSRQG